MSILWRYRFNIFHWFFCIDVIMISFLCYYNIVTRSILILIRYWFDINDLLKSKIKNQIWVILSTYHLNIISMSNKYRINVTWKKYRFNINSAFFPLFFCINIIIISFLCQYDIVTRFILILIWYRFDINLYCPLQKPQKFEQYWIDIDTI